MTKLWLYIVAFLCVWTNAAWCWYFFYVSSSTPSETTVIHSLQNKVHVLLANGGPSDKLLNDSQEVFCDGCDRALANRINTRFRFFVLNLDRRPDKLGCVQKQLRKFGIRASRIPGVDSMAFAVDEANLLPAQVKKFLHTVDPTKRGHVGCLYGHVNFLLTAAQAEMSCGDAPSPDLRSILGFRDVIHLTFRNRLKDEKEANIYFVDQNGQEQHKGVIAAGRERTFTSHLMEAWRVRMRGATMLEFNLDSSKISSLYELDILGRTAVVHIFDCVTADLASASPSSTNQAEITDNRISILFEDDVVLREDFGEKLIWSFDQLEKHRKDTWDIMLLNWYCNNRHWKECNRNEKGGFSKKIASIPFTPRDERLYDYTMHSSFRKEFSVVPVRTFMSGSAYAVSQKGAQRLLETFPCNTEKTHAACSMAVDWHYSALANSLGFRVYGVSPPFVLMPGMGGVQTLDIVKPPKSLTANTCGTYRSDTDIKDLGRASPKAMVENRLETWRRQHQIKFANGNTQGRFTAYDVSKTWSEANKACKANGGILATIKNSFENAEVLELTKRTCGHTKAISGMGGWELCGWIGLNDYQTEGVNVWSSGYTGTYTNFVSGEPNNRGDEDGMAICWTFEGKWIDYSNVGQLPCFVCETHS